MKIETILNAMVKAYHEQFSLPFHNIREDQYRVFRARILRMFEERDIEIASLMECVEEGDSAVKMYQEILDDKDAEIIRLKSEIENCREMMEEEGYY